VSDATGGHPFLRYREALTAWRRAADHDLSDARFEAIVTELDAAVAEVDGAGFVETPLVALQATSERTGARVFAKIEAGSVSGSHKARHLFGIMVDLLVREAVGDIDGRPSLAIASCGNAALAAAVVARAARWPLSVYVPPDAAESTLARLEALGADVLICARTPSTIGDPTVARFRREVADGAIPFCCQGTDNPITFDGGEVLGRELGDSIHASGGPDGGRIDHVFVQVGGGALMSGVWLGMQKSKLGAGRAPRFHAVQTLGGYPLIRGWRIALDDVTSRLQGGLAEAAIDPRFAVEAAAGPAAAAARESTYRRMKEEPDCYMWPWHDPPKSIAHGILDDETYDFRDCVEAMINTGGVALGVSETAIEQARAATEREANIGTPISYTGAAGLAGLLTAAELGIVKRGESAVVLLTGARR